LTEDDPQADQRGSRLAKYIAGSVNFLANSIRKKSPARKERGCWASRPLGLVHSR